jgi:hypothetical protein
LPHSVRPFSIHNCDVTPHGGNANMSKSDTNYPDQGQWTNNDPKYDYTIILPSNVWAQVDSSCSLTFTLTKGQTSCIYQVIPTAPTGPSSYKLTRSDGQACQYHKHKLFQDPDVIINS